MRELSITFDRMVHSLRRSRSALKDEQKLSMAYHAARVWVWEHHIKTGKIEVINPSSTEEVGTGHFASSCVKYMQMIAELCLQQLTMAMQSGVYRVEFRVRRNGDYLWASSWGQMVEGGEVLMGVTADVTTVKKERGCEPSVSGSWRPRK